MIAKILVIVVVAGCGRAGFDAMEGLDATPRPYRDAVLADAPLGYWRLGEQGGSIAHDEMARFDGQYVGACTYDVAGALASEPDAAVRFDGASCYVVVGDPFPVFAANAPFTIEVWVLSSGTTTFQHVFSKQFTSGGPPIDGYALLDSPGGAYLERSVASDNRGSTYAILPAGRFTHVVGVFDGAQLLLYIDGNAAGAPRPATDAMPSFTAPAVIGSGSTNPNFYPGVIDEVAVYDKALAPSRIRAHHDAGITPL